MQFHILSLEGPDPYARAGGLATRVDGLARALAGLGCDTHLWFVGDPALAGCEAEGDLHLHRWCQWISAYHPGGVYDGEEGKRVDYARSLPPHLVREVIDPQVCSGGAAVVLAEEWHTVDAVLHLDWLLRRLGLRSRVTILWNANNTIGFERIDWARLAAAARITTVSRYMKQRMREIGIDALVIPNGLGPESFDPPARAPVAALRARFRDRVLLAKMARFDPDKRWLASVQLVAAMKEQGWQPLLVARGGLEAHGHEVFAAARAAGLRIADRAWIEPGPAGLVAALRDVDNVDIVNLRSHVDPPARRALFRAADAVLANSDHEPFGLVGLEAMAVEGLACTGCSGEDYVVPGRNALVVETADPREFMGLFARLRQDPRQDRLLRRAGGQTARHFSWGEIVQRVILPRLEFLGGPA